MRWVMATVALGAEVRDSMLYIEGGSPEWLSVSDIGAGRLLQVTIAGCLEVPRERWGRPLPVPVRVVSDFDGEERQNGGFDLDLTRDGDVSKYTAGAPLLHPFVRKVPVEIAVAGGYTMTLDAEGAQTVVKFGVRLGEGATR